MIELNGIRKVFLLGDLHLGVRNNSTEWFEIQKSFLLDFFIRKIKEDGFDPETDVLFQAGDWNHVRESTNVRLWNSSLDIADALSKTFNKGVYIILGNHDVYYKDRTDTHSLKGFDRMFKNFKIFEEPEILRINGKHKFLMLPWIENVDEISRVVIEHSGKVDYILCHSDIKGFRLNKWTKLEHGLEMSTLKTFKRIYSGHIHIRQESENSLYVGTPYHMDRGDRGNTKGSYVLDFSSGELEERFVENTESPQYVKYDMYDVLNLNLEELSKMFRNNFVDIMIDAEFASKFPYTQFTELVKPLAYRHIEFFTYNKEQKTKSERDSEGSYEYNIFDILEDQMKARNYSELLTKELKTKFKEIYDSLKNTKNHEQ